MASESEWKNWGNKNVKYTIREYLTVKIIKEINVIFNYVQEFF